jgi:hypothetical protein
MTCATSEIKCYFEQLDIFKCCFSFKDTINRMTPPLTFRRNIMKALFLLDDKLPLNSHVILVGLVQADFIYPAMAERLHPIGNVDLWVISTSYLHIFQEVCTLMCTTKTCMNGSIVCKSGRALVG